MEQGGHRAAFFLGVINGLYRMGIHYLSGLYLAVFSVSALAADPPVPRSNVSATLNPTTSYYSSTNSTVRLPSGVSISPSSASVPVVSRYSGGLQQSMPTGITIDAIKKSAPLPVAVRSTTQSVKGAATRCLTGMKCNLVFMAGAAGLQQLLDGLDWVMGDGGKIQKLNTNGVPADYVNNITSCQNFITENQTCPNAGYSSHVDSSAERNIYCRPSWSVYPLTGYANYRCYYGGTSAFETVDVSDSDIALGVESNYNPDPLDWRYLSPELNLDDVEITWAPTLESNPKTTTIYDADGNAIEVQETNIWYDFDIRDNPSPSPALDLKTRQETKTYKNGQLTGTTSTIDTVSAGAAGGGGSNVNIDIPTDCEFMPTVCAFLDWFKNDDPPDDPDLSALIDNRDFTETYSITGGSKQCPADYEFTVDFIGRTYGLSFEPACDFASKMYYFVMAAAYIFAAYITIGASRNG